MVARLSERELIRVAITKEKAPFGLYSCAAVQAGFGKVKNVLTRLTTSTHRVPWKMRKSMKPQSKKRNSISEEDIGLKPG